MFCIGDESLWVVEPSSTEFRIEKIRAFRMYPRLAATPRYPNFQISGYQPSDWPGEKQVTTARLSEELLSAV